MALAARTKLGPYGVQSPLGAGGMGEVYRARDPRLGRDVAIKVLPSHLSGNASALVRFEREAKVLAALSHPRFLRELSQGLAGLVSAYIWSPIPLRCSPASRCIPLLFAAALAAFSGSELNFSRPIAGDTKTREFEKVAT